ncbi:MAG: HlyC/CorC family transporter [Lewinellaceae bacterium]|nr:HlyC/CorC family transporter [Phaeodactylibacter sp.]MCB9039672.1 HlyC/CorC family transporter [Lewinellaceae bacterium]
MIGNILLTLFLVLLNGFFVAAEFAIVKVRTSQIQVRTQQNLAARVAESVIANLDAYLAATQLGITLASLGLGWIGEGVVSEIILATMHGLGLEISEAAAHQIALPTSFALITVLHIVFGELAPKSLAIRFPTRTAMLTAIPLRVFYFIFAWPIRLLNGIANAFLKLIGIQPVPHAEVHSEEELKLIIAESAEGGAIHSSERELIQNVFNFDDRLVRQVLKPRTQIIALDVETPIGEAIETALAEGYSRFPVYEKSVDNIFGFVTTKDLLAAAYRKEQASLREMARPVIFTPVSRKVMSLLRQFQRERSQLAVVVSEFGGTVGLVTMEDILEELVGEIQDEYDSEQPVVEKTGENRFRVLAQNPVDEINHYLPEPLPESADYVTLAGLILQTAQDVPTAGQTFAIGNYQVKITLIQHTSPEEVELEWQGQKS